MIEYFINRVATKIIHMDRDGSLVFDGDYDAFKSFLASRAEVKTGQPLRSKTGNPAAESAASNKPSMRSRKDQEIQDSLFEERVYGDRRNMSASARKSAVWKPKSDSWFDKIAQTRRAIDSIFMFF
jgi:ATPase subunit of ABC transporter with duplicated ATPase domains